MKGARGTFTMREIGSLTGRSYHFGGGFPRHHILSDVDAPVPPGYVAVAVAAMPRLGN